MKGGVGKTHTLVNIGYTLAKKFNKKILYVDMDPQMNATQYVLDDINIQDAITHEKEKTIVGLLHGNTSIELKKVDGIDHLRVLPSSLTFLKYDTVLHNNISFLKDAIDSTKLRDKFDYILIDSPPTVSDYTTAAMIASDGFVAPVQHYLSVTGLLILDYYIEQIIPKKGLKVNLSSRGIIFNNVNVNHTAFHKAYNILTQSPNYKAYLYSNLLPSSVSVIYDPEITNISKRFYVNQRGPNSLSEPIIKLTQEFIKRTN